jgi:predicted phosphodiesterase
MRLGVISDTHGNLPALEAVLAHARKQGVDGLVNLGDCVSAPLWPAETLALLDALNISSVRGNHDRWLAEPARATASQTVAFTVGQLSAADCARLAALPDALELPGDVLAVHGRPGSDCEYLLETSCDEQLMLVPPSVLEQRLSGVTASLVLCGHSHLQHSAVSRGRLVVNPGAVGCPRAAGNPDPPANEAGSPHARYAVVTRRAAGWSVEFHVLAYDWSAVTDRARAMGRADWAAGFLNDA